MEMMDYNELDRHNRIALQQQPDLSKLVKLCQRLAPGTTIVLRLEKDLGALLKRYRVIKGAHIHYSYGKPNNCHGNIAALWRKAQKVGQTFQIMTGYSMIDTVWRQHSFGTFPDGSVLETTVGREIYMGYPLTDDEAALFALSELGPVGGTKRVAASYAGLGGLGSVDRLY